MQDLREDEPPNPRGQGWRKSEHLRSADAVRLVRHLDVLEELALPVEGKPDLEWVTKQGYLLTSSAYLLALGIGMDRHVRKGCGCARLST